MSNCDGRSIQRPNKQQFFVSIFSLTTNLEFLASNFNSFSNQKLFFLLLINTYIKYLNLPQEVTATVFSELPSTRPEIADEVEKWNMSLPSKKISLLLQTMVLNGSRKPWVFIHSPYKVLSKCSSLSFVASPIFVRTASAHKCLLTPSKHPRKGQQKRHPAKRPQSLGLAPGEMPTLPACLHAYVACAGRHKKLKLLLVPHASLVGKIYLLN